MPFVVMAQERVEADPEVEIRVPRSHTVSKVLLFPLELPRYVIKYATYPLAATGRFIERKHVVERTIDFLSNEERTLFVYPIIEIGAGSGIGGGPWDTTFRSLPSRLSCGC